MTSVTDRNVHDAESTTNDYDDTLAVVLGWPTIADRRPNSTPRRRPLDPSGDYRTVAAFCGVPAPGSVEADTGGKP